MASKPLADYEKDVPAVAELLTKNTDLQKLFTDLTPGYQREWARFIFGAKAEATKQRHIEVMKTVLKAGYKSKRAYDSRPKD
ncbi:YdeI/OmpD-associated family protein [Secundilactobacillus silagei]|uniref:YdeI/OmpD-associated family protein n=1 Tax=Secundilactobacillus silagei JCM 19001 TaxID=1302250 RepID=A0A1Z5IHN2_9LACO|nr:YdeI/OmpD-associated family protein [Secundilactobacillus silagei]TDG67334.1 hypothetical protein C5L25_000930 [Secundilactobacillus silagei JCM 19001]GAX01277.1 hypothetical protein IWT126_01303 [Secundilactobacillus silagei JCM 19001]